jgi:hypothetical protein
LSTSLCGLELIVSTHRKVNSASRGVQPDSRADGRQSIKNHDVERLHIVLSEIHTIPSLLLAAFVLFTIDVIFLIHIIPHLSMPEGLPVFFSDLHAS